VLVGRRKTELDQVEVDLQAWIQQNRDQ